MSAADRFRRHGRLARVLVERLRAGTTLTATAPGADAREVEEAAADALEALLAEPAPVAGVSAEERAQIDAIAMGAREVFDSVPEDRRLPRSLAVDVLGLHAIVLRLLAALDAAEARAARAEREREEATQGAEALAARLTEIRSLYEDARAEWRLGGDDASG